MVIIFLSKSEARFFGVLLGICFLTGMIVYQYRTTLVEGWMNQLTVVLDPGHGGVDGGACDIQGNLEKDINLSIGLQIEKQLRQSGLNVVMTRRTDADLAPFRSGQRGRHRRDLLRRIEIARQHRSLFLVSIHCDSSVETRKSGAFVFYNWRSSPSKTLANTIQQEINRVQTEPGKSAPGKYLVIRQNGLTGVLVEVGYLSNPEEGQRLHNSQYQAQMGLAIARGILEYIRNQPARWHQLQALQAVWRELTRRWIGY